MKKKSKSETIDSSNIKSQPKSKEENNKLDLNNNTDITKQNKSNIYFGYYSRLALYTILSLSLLYVLVVLIFKTFSISKIKSISYVENSNIDYKVNLKENDLYDEKVLDKDMSYVASLIKSISTTFDYNFKLDQVRKIEYSYDIIGKLLITDDNGKVYFEKKYVLLDNQNKISDTGNFNINETLSIDYDYYNEVSNKFRNQTGISTNSSLVIYLDINKDFMNRKELSNFEKNSSMYINIPLSEKTVNINLNYEEINKKNFIYEKEKINISNNLLLIAIDIIVAICFALCLVKLIKLLSLLFTKKTKYDKYIDKLLKDYDRLIVLTDTNIDLEKYNVVTIRQFNELVDIRDNMKLPIFYYPVQKHIKSYFYIKNDNDLYLLILKAADINDN